MREIGKLKCYLDVERRKSIWFCAPRLIIFRILKLNFLKTHESSIYETWISNFSRKEIIFNDDIFIILNLSRVKIIDRSSASRNGNCADIFRFEKSYKLANFFSLFPIKFRLIGIKSLERVLVNNGDVSFYTTRRIKCAG